MMIFLTGKISPSTVFARTATVILALLASVFLQAQIVHADFTGSQLRFNAKIERISSSGAVTFSDIDALGFEVRGSFRLFGLTDIDQKTAQSLLQGAPVTCTIRDESYSSGFFGRFKSWFAPVPVKCGNTDFGDISNTVPTDIGAFLIEKQLATPRCPEGLGFYSLCDRTFSSGN